MSSSPLTVRFSEETRTSLEAAAAAEHRSVSNFVVQATEAALANREAKRKMIEAAMAEADEGYFIPEEEFTPWFMSLGTDEELPKPQARKLDI